MERMIKKKLIVITSVLSLVLLLGGCMSSKYDVSGTVLDYQGNGVAGVNISFAGQGKTTTDQNGHWAMTLKGYGDVTTIPTKTGWLFAPAEIDIRHNLEFIDQETLFLGMKADEEVMVFEPALEEEIRRYFPNLSASDKITAADALGLNYLTARYLSISNLDGMQYFLGLEDVDLSNNNITDITPLENLRYINFLNLGYNQLSDLSKLVKPLNNIRLESLNLIQNGISDISQLSNIKFEKRLNLALSDNAIQDISVLANLDLRSIWLGNNKISDISSLKNQELQVANLSSNQIKDIAALAGMTDLEELYLGQNQIEDISSLKDLTSLTELDISSNQIRNIDVLVNLEKLECVYLFDNNLDLTDGSGARQVIEQLQNRGVEVLWDGNTEY